MGMRKKRIVPAMAVVLAAGLCLGGCSASTEPAVDKEEGTQEAIPTSAPEIVLVDVLSDNMNSCHVRSGNYDWNYQNGENIVGGLACGAHPMDEAKMSNVATLQIRQYEGTEEVTYSFSCEVMPDEVTIRQWDIEDIGNTDAEAASVATLDQDIFLVELAPDRVYEFSLVWKKENVEQKGCFGAASYVLVTADVD